MTQVWRKKVKTSKYGKMRSVLLVRRKAEESIRTKHLIHHTFKWMDSSIQKMYSTSLKNHEQGFL
jgi:hypothetical protein